MRTTNPGNNKSLADLEVSGGHPDVVLLAGVVELGEAPVDQTELPVLMVDHDVVGLHVSVHDAHAVTVVERLQELVKVVPGGKVKLKLCCSRPIGQCQ